MFNPTSSNAQLLYLHLLNINNRCNWRKDFTVANTTLQALSGLSRSQLDKARNELAQKGFIRYDKGGGNTAGKYLMVSFDTQTHTQIDTQAEHKPHTNGAQPAHKPRTLVKHKTKLNETKQGYVKAPQITSDGEASTDGVFDEPKPPKPKPPPKPPKPEKLTLGEFKHVLLTEGELAKLKAEHTNTDEIIKFLDEYIEEKGYKSKSHYMAIGRWVVDAVEKRSSERAKYQPKQQQKKPAPKRDFTERQYSDEFYDKLFEQKGDA